MASGGPAGEIGGRTLQQIMEDTFNQNVHPSVPSQYRTTVVSYTYQGKDSAGNRVYKIALKRAGQVNYTTRAFNGTSLVAPQVSSSPSTPGGGGGPDHLTDDLAGDAALARARDQWLTTIANLVASPFHKRNLISAVEGHGGDAASLNQKMAQLVKAMPPIDAEIAGGGADPFDPFAGIDLGGGGFGGGGGFSGPTYVAPDRRVVEDFVTGALVGLIGSVPSDDMMNQFADLYMADHRRNFDNPEQEIDPSQSVKEAIRETEHYQQIHQLRPDSEDERAWVAQRRQAAAQGGLDTGRQEDFAITQATVGGDLDDVQKAAGVAQLQQSGNMRGTQLQDQLRGVTQAMFRGVVR